MRKSAIERQKEAVLGLLKSPNKWYTYATDYQTVEMICALTNLGIAETRAGKWTIKSAEAARRFLTRETKPVVRS